jgi:preprotein translocase subunit SecG
MMTVVIAIHASVCFLLIVIILVQAGRGGGLLESLSDVESIFGTKTNSFLTRTTTILSIVFFITCLSLAFLSARQSKSLMSKALVNEPIQQTQANAEEQPVLNTTPKAE